MMRLLGWLLMLPLVLGCLVIGLLSAALESRPLIAAAITPTMYDLQRIESLIDGHADDQPSIGQDRLLRISEQDLNLILDQVFGRSTDIHTRVHMVADVLHGQLTWRLPPNPFNPYLNLTFEIAETQGLPRVTRLKFGQLQLPVTLDAQLLGRLIASILKDRQIPLAQARFRRLYIGEKQLTLVYQWDPALARRAPSMAVSRAESRTIAVYYRALHEILESHPRQLATLLRPVFRLAQSRSQAGAGDPVDENRAALIALGLYGLGSGAHLVMPEAADLPPLGAPRVRLRGRQDLSRHFLVSAALTASSDSGLSAVLGLYKEWSDSQGGSGFSFADLAADKAGTRFGELATKDPDSARSLQHTLSRGLDNGDLLPKVDDLPENLSEKTLTRSFGGIGSERYTRMTAAIDRRIRALPLYRSR